MHPKYYGAYSTTTDLLSGSQGHWWTNVIVLQTSGQRIMTICCTARGDDFQMRSVSRSLHVSFGILTAFGIEVWCQVYGHYGTCRMIVLCLGPIVRLVHHCSGGGLLCGGEWEGK